MIKQVLLVLRSELRQTLAVVDMTSAYESYINDCQQCVTKGSGAITRHDMKGEGLTAEAHKLQPVLVGGCYVQ